MRRRFFIVAIMIAASGVDLVSADEVRYCQQQGVTYQEVRRRVQCPVLETQWKQCAETVYCEKVETQWRDATQTRLCPITEWRYQPEWVGRWNPFVQPTLTYRLTPVTRYESRTETVKVPVAVRQFVPQTRTVARAETTYRMANREVVVSRMPVCPAAAPCQPAPSCTYNGLPIGGIKRLDSDPSSFGMDTAWRASTTP